jgi:hypothetical protein
LSPALYRAGLIPVDRYGGDRVLWMRPTCPH